ncbi:MAG: YeeE/YedE family protein [Gammaproteobacteria bacterium]|nr:YeeE/YedE family protein [Gammaproteobacteria bacterium]
MELEVAQKIALLGFIAAAVMGAVANKTHFCSMGAISDWVHMGAKGRMGAWFGAIGIAILGTQALALWWDVDIGASRYLSTNFTWLSYVVGGILFGIGMTLAAGCGQRNLVRVGGGNLRALVVLIIMGITAYATMRGFLALARIEWLEPSALDLTALGLTTQGLPAFVGQWTGIEDTRMLTMGLAAIFGLGLVAFALRQADFRGSFDNVFAAVVIGGVIIAGWYITGVLGNDDFEPVPVESISFIASVGNSINYLMTYTGSTINFGIAVVGGMIFGSFLYALLSGNFRWETFSNRSEMITHLWGGALMGTGGVLSLGCTIGQGVTGFSTLAVGSMIALASIMLGSAATMKVQYYMLDDKGFLSAFGGMLRDFVTLRWQAA